MSRLSPIFFSIVILLFFSQQAGAITLKRAGDIGQFIPVGMSILLMGEHRDTEGLEEFTKSSVLGAFITFGMKYTINQKRPNDGPYSMPSGHTWSAVNGTEFIRRRYGWILAIPAYAVSGIVGYSRIQVDAHYPQDVLAGAIIGVITNYVFVEEFLITPYYSKNTFGATLKMTW